jgi:hypothetical protein
MATDVSGEPVTSILGEEDAGSMFFRNFGNCLQEYKMSKSERHNVKKSWLLKYGLYFKIYK